MKSIVKHYSNGEVTVVWQPALCIHAKHCVQGQPSVFNFERRPWIDPTAASSEAMMRQVEQCPSGALSYFRNAEALASVNSATPIAAADTAALPETVRVQVQAGGPLIITGLVEVLLPGGQAQRHPRTALCRCGQSANKPYCDGAHHQLPAAWDQANEEPTA